MDPLTRGDYPLSMRRIVRNRLPRFTEQQSKLVKGAFDFIGINYYTANYADNLPPSNGLKSYITDARANLTGESWINHFPLGSNIKCTVFAISKYKYLQLTISTVYTNFPIMLGVRNGAPIGPQVICHVYTYKQIFHNRFHIFHVC